MNRELGRFAAYKPLEIGLKLAGKAGVAGVVVGSGKGYFGKLGDGIMVLPDAVSYAPRMYRDIKNLANFGDGVTKAAQSTQGIWDGVTSFDVDKTYKALVQGDMGVRQLYDVATGIDYNGIWRAVQNFSHNAADQPAETAAAALAVLGLGYALGRGARFWGTRGQGTILDRTERRLGSKVWKSYFRKADKKQEK